MTSVASRELRNNTTALLDRVGAGKVITITVDEIAVSIITIGELQAGVHAARDLPTRERRLDTLIRALEFQPAPSTPRLPMPGRGCESRCARPDCECR